MLLGFADILPASGRWHKLERLPLQAMRRAGLHRPRRAWVCRMDPDHGPVLLRLHDHTRRGSGRRPMVPSAVRKHLEYDGRWLRIRLCYDLQIGLIVLSRADRALSYDPIALHS